MVDEAFNVEEYWQVKALSVEWLYVLQKLSESVKAAPHEQHCVVGVGWDGTPLYLLKRSHYPAATLSAVTGIAEGTLLAFTGVLTLKAKAVEGLPEATVPYWGTA